MCLVCFCNIECPDNNGKYYHAAGGGSLRGKLHIPAEAPHRHSEGCPVG